MKNIGICIIFFSFLLALQGRAGFYIEPAITYESGDNKLQWPAPLSESTGTTKGMGFNLKLGYHAANVFFMGVDGSYSQPRFEHSVNDYAADSKSTLYGAILGAQMPIVGVRLWAGYIFGGDLDPDESNGVDVKFEGAKGPKFGFGFRVLMVSLNIEYADLEYDTSKLEQAGPISGALDNKLKNKVGLVSFSMPLTL